MIGLRTSGEDGELFGKFRFDVKLLSRELRLRNMIDRVLSAPNSVDFTKTNDELVEALLGPFLAITEPPTIKETAARHPFRTSHYNKPVFEYGIDLTLAGSAELVDYWPDETLPDESMVFDRPIPRSGMDIPNPDWIRDQHTLKFTCTVEVGERAALTPDDVAALLQSENARATAIVEAVSEQTKLKRTAVREWLLDELTARRAEHDKATSLVEALPFKTTLPTQPLDPKAETDTNADHNDEVAANPSESKAMNEPPIVFISHASSDKETFVTEFAQRLRENGVEVWLDERSLLVGDSLATHIADGIREADATVIVLSEQAIGRPWVTEELRTAKHQQVVKGKRLIPIILGDVDEDMIPASVEGLFQHRVQLVNGKVDEDAFEKALEDVLRAVFEVRQDTKPIGPPPEYILEGQGQQQPRPKNVPSGLEEVELQVLEQIGKIATRDNDSFMQTSGIVTQAKVTYGLAEDDVLDTLEVLAGENFIKIDKSMHPERIRQMGHFTFLAKGIVWFHKIFVLGSPTMEAAIYGHLADGPTQGDLKDIAERSGASLLLVELIAERLHEQKILLVSRSMGPSNRYHVLSPPMLQKRARNPNLLTATLGRQNDKEGLDPDPEHQNLGSPNPEPSGANDDGPTEPKGLRASPEV